MSVEGAAGGFFSSFTFNQHYSQHFDFKNLLVYPGGLRLSRLKKLLGEAEGLVIPPTGGGGLGLGGGVEWERMLVRACVGGGWPGVGCDWP